MTTSTDPFEGRSVWQRAVEWLFRRRLYANVRADGMSGGGQKLQPINDLLARTGREPRAPE